MKKRIIPVVKGLLLLLVLAWCLHIAACVLYDGPVVFTFSVQPGAIRSQLNQRWRILNFTDASCTDGDIHAPGLSVPIRWYTSHVPAFFSFGTDAYALCLVPADAERNGSDICQLYLGTPRAIDSVTRRYAVGESLSLAGDE